MWYAYKKLRVPNLWVAQVFYPNCNAMLKGGEAMGLGRRRPLVWAILGVLVLAVLGGLAYSRPFQSAAGKVAASAPPDAGSPPKLPVKRITFLVMGVDKRPGDAGRSDTMLVVSYDPKSQQLAAVSLARDTLAQIPGHGLDKVNHSYAYGGEPLTIATVQKLLDIPIDHYVTITFQGFREIVDAVGGIDINVEKRMYYHDPYDLSMGPDGLLIDLYPGLQHMDGETALKYARFRHDELGDLGRVKRQQEVVKAVMRAAARKETLVRAPQIIRALAKTVETDLSIADMLSLASGGQEALSKPLRTATLDGEPVEIDGGYYLVPDLVALRTKAYETLVGESPQEEFLQRARAEQAAYQRAVARLTEADQPRTSGETSRPSQPANPETNPQQPQAVSKPGTGTHPDGGQQFGNNTGQPGTGNAGTPPQPGAGNGSATPPANPPGNGSGAAPSQGLAVAVVDASGHGILMDYLPRLKAAGLQVVRVSTSQTPLPRTVVIDHAGLPGTTEKLQAVLPSAVLVADSNRQAGVAVEIMLGQDLVPSGDHPQPAQP
jgi:LCP family protein required for cell wall assembly